MKRWLIPPAWTIVLAACLWWLGVFIVDAIASAPHPRIVELWMDWRQMALVYRTAPWIVLPFAFFAAWALAFRARHARTPPAWLTWASGIAVLSWTGFVLWRAHDQAFKCAAWAEDFYHLPYCWMGKILQSVSWWLVIPALCWLVVAIARRPVTSKS